MRTSISRMFPAVFALGCIFNLSSYSQDRPQSGKTPPPLRWAPPELVNPITLELGAGPTFNRLDKTKDYIVKLPATKKVGAVGVDGGRNIVIHGGYITVPPGARNDSERRAIYIKNAVGTVHIEGIKIDNSGGSDFDGIVVNAPEAIIQIQNCRITGLTGSFKGFHADIFQPWGGAKEIRIDRLTGTSNYQGFQIPADLGPIGSATIQNVNLSYLTEDTGGYLLWLTRGLNACTTYPMTFSNVYIAPRPGLTTGQRSVWPSTVTPAACTAVQNGDEVSWPKLPMVQGVVKQGVPPTGDYVPEGTAGLNYVSPGYLKG